MVNSCGCSWIMGGVNAPFYPLLSEQDKGGGLRINPEWDLNHVSVQFHTDAREAWSQP